MQVERNKEGQKGQRKDSFKGVSKKGNNKSKSDSLRLPERRTLLLPQQKSATMLMNHEATARRIRRGANYGDYESQETYLRTVELYFAVHDNIEERGRTDGRAPMDPQIFGLAK